MSDSNVDVVRRGFVGFQKLDMDAFVADWARDVVWDVRGYKDWSGTKTQYRGAHEVLAAFASYWAASAASRPPTSTSRRSKTAACSAPTTSAA